MVASASSSAATQNAARTAALPILELALATTRSTSDWISTGSWRASTSMPLGIAPPIRPMKIS